MVGWMDKRKTGRKDELEKEGKKDERDSEGRGWRRKIMMER